VAWTSVGSVTVGPLSQAIRFGQIEVPPQGGIEMQCRQTSADQKFKFAYGLLSFESPLGRELGTVKCWPVPEWTSFKLGEGLSSLSRSGSLVFEPRSYNLRWVKEGFPWSIAFRADIGFDLPADRIRAPGFVDAVDVSLPLVKVGTQGRIQF
jgi:hypothetical protein